MKNIKLLKKCQIVLFFLLCNVALHGQTTNDLDIKNGFKIFILGSSLENYKQYDNGLQVGATKYITIKNTEHNKIGDIFIDYIKLEFTQNKLVSIQVSMNYKYRTDIYDILKEAYGLPNIKAYDEHHEYDVNTGKLAWIATQAEWAGNNVSLKLWGDGSFGDNSNITLTFTSKDAAKIIENQKNNSIKKASKEL